MRDFPSFEFLAMIQQMIFSISSFTGCLEFAPEFSKSPLEGLMCVILGIPYISFPLFRSYV